MVEQTLVKLDGPDSPITSTVNNQAIFAANVLRTYTSIFDADRTPYENDTTIRTEIIFASVHSYNIAYN